MDAEEVTTPPRLKRVKFAIGTSPDIIFFSVC
jgi:hypothetical protein